jgi:hypothetical protein
VRFRGDQLRSFRVVVVPGEDTAQECVVHAADHVGVPLREVVERAVVQHRHTITTRLRLEATLP